MLLILAIHRPIKIGRFLAYFISKIERTIIMSKEDFYDDIEFKHIDSKILEKAANYLNNHAPEHSKKHYFVDTCWFDDGAKLYWTTILCKLKDNDLITDEYQALDPADQDLLGECENDDDIADACDVIIARHKKYSETI